ncbi:MAG: hypothetical protein SFV18_18040 [Bryobacteraceae bacterium]|nr:hypothetical protein [Bryobacteraceae bacterium]
MAFAFAYFSFLGYWFFFRLSGIELLWQVAFNGAIFALGGAAAFLIRRLNRNQDETLSLSLTGETRVPIPEPAQVAVEIRTYLAERLFIVGALFARSASEAFRRNTEITVDQALHMRGSYNKWLRQVGLWDKCELDERDLLGAPEGGWTEEQTLLNWTWCEQLRLLRWVLRIDKQIEPLAHFPKPHHSRLSDLPNWQVATLANGDVLRSWDLRAERDLAVVYTFAACAEREVRSLASEPFEDATFQEIRAKYLSAPEDFLAGIHTIRELGDDDLHALVALAAARAGYAAYLIDLLEAPSPFTFASWQESQH